MKLLKNYLWNVSYQLFAIIVPVILFPYVNRVLGPSGVGINSFTNSLATIFMVIGDLGVMNYGTKKIAECGDDIKKRSSEFFEITIMRFITVISMFLAYVFYVSYNGVYVKFYMLQGVLILASAIDFSWFFMGLENFKTISIRNFCVRLCTLICIFIFVKNSNDLWKYILIMSLSNLIANVVMVSKARKFIVKASFSMNNVFIHWKMALIFFIPQISMQVYQTLYKYILGIVTNVTNTGYYDNSDKLISLIITLLSSLSMVMLPYLSKKRKNSKGLNEDFNQYFDVMIMCSLPMTAGVAAISLKFAPWFFGSSFKIDGILLMIESITIFMISISLAFSSYFITTNQVKLYNKAIVYGGILSLTLGFTLMLSFGIIGAMWGTVCTETFISMYEIYLLRKQIKILKLFRHIKEYLLGSLMMFIVVFVLCNLYTFNLFMLVLNVIVGVIIYILVITFTNYGRFKLLYKTISSYLFRRN